MSQNQKAGAGAQQLQVMGDFIIQQGVTEERAAEIADKQARQVIAEYSRESAEEAAARITKLDERVVKLLALEGKLDALQDPAYQIALRKAQVGAASTDRDGDYDLLARLLGQRAGQDSRYVRASVDRAVQVVDMIDDAALQGLTMMWIILVLTPGGHTLGMGLDQLGTMLQRFPHDNLPTGRRWLDHLDMIDLVRITPGGLTQLKKFVPLYADRWPGFLSTGFDGATAADIKIECMKRGINVRTVAEHELKPDHYRFPYHSSGQFRDVLKASNVPDDDVEFIVELARSRGNLDVRDEALIPKMEEALAASPVLSTVRTWWDQISDYPQLTSAGVTIAYANALRYHQEFSTINGLQEYLQQTT